MVGDAIAFTQRFFESVRREAVEYDPTGYDDGVPRRWHRSRYDTVKQLRPLAEVGTQPGVTKKPHDQLFRPHTVRQPGRRDDTPAQVAEHRVRRRRADCS